MSNVLPFDQSKRRTPSHTSANPPPEVIHTTSLRREDLPWIGVFEVGPYQIPLFVGLPDDVPPSAA